MEGVFFVCFFGLSLCAHSACVRFGCSCWDVLMGLIGPVTSSYCSMAPGDSSKVRRQLATKKRLALTSYVRRAGQHEPMPPFPMRTRASYVRMYAVGATIADM